MDLENIEQLLAVVLAARRVAAAARARYETLESQGPGGLELAQAQSELADADCVEEALQRKYDLAVADA
jgi:hypothetical protein